MIQVLRPDEVYELFSIIISNPRERLNEIPLFEYFCELSQSRQTLAMRHSDLFKTPNSTMTSKYFSIDESNQLVIFKDVSSLIKGCCFIQQQCIDCYPHVSLAPRVFNVIMTAVDTDEILDHFSKLDF